MNAMNLMDHRECVELMLIARTLTDLLSARVHQDFQEIHISSALTSTNVQHLTLVAITQFVKILKVHILACVQKEQLQIPIQLFGVSLLCLAVQTTIAPETLFAILTNVVSALNQTLETTAVIHVNI